MRTNLTRTYIMKFISTYYYESYYQSKEYEWQSVEIIIRRKKNVDSSKNDRNEFDM